MIVQLRPDAPPALIDVDRLDRLHAECPGALAAMASGPLCRPDADGAHVWLDIAAARTAGDGASADPEWVGKFDRMIDGATSMGWTDDTGTLVRAHVEFTTDHAGDPS